MREPTARMQMHKALFPFPFLLFRQWHYAQQQARVGYTLRVCNVHRAAQNEPKRPAAAETRFRRARRVQAARLRLSGAGVSAATAQQHGARNGGCVATTLRTCVRCWENAMGACCCHVRSVVQHTAARQEGGSKATKDHMVLLLRKKAPQQSRQNKSIHSASRRCGSAVRKRRCQAVRENPRSAAGARAQRCARRHMCPRGCVLVAVWGPRG